MKVYGLVENFPAVFLVDSGSSHNFIDISLVKHSRGQLIPHTYLLLKLLMVVHLQVLVGWLRSLLEIKIMQPYLIFMLYLLVVVILLWESMAENIGTSFMGF